jgi:hypothetical protein
MLDGSFGSGSQVRPQQVVQVPDGSFVVGGFLQTPGQSTVQQFVARYSPTGQLDPSFGSGGVILPNGVVRNLTPLPDGRLVVTAFSLPGGVGVLDATGTMTSISDQLFPGQLIRRPDGAVISLDGTARTRGCADQAERQRGHQLRFRRRLGAPTSSRMGTSNVAYSPPNATMLSDGRLAVAFAYSTPAPGQVLCGLVALLDDGRYDASFGTNGLVSLPQAICRVTHFVDDRIRVTGDIGDPVVAVSPDGAHLGTLSAPFDDPNLAFEGTGRFHRQGTTSDIVALDSAGNVDTAFGVNGIATLPGMTISGFALLDSGDIK